MTASMGVASWIARPRRGPVCGAGACKGKKGRLCQRSSLGVAGQFPGLMGLVLGGSTGTRWCVLWCGVVWCGVVWCGVVWCGGVWCGVVSGDVLWPTMVCFAVLCSAVQCLAVPCC